MVKDEKAAIAMAAFILLVVVVYVCWIRRIMNHAERVDRYEIRVTIRLATDPNVES